MLFDGVVDPLDEHAGQVGPLEHVGHGGTVTKRVNCPGAVRDYTCNRGNGGVKIKIKIPQLH